MEQDLKQVFKLNDQEVATAMRMLNRPKVKSTDTKVQSAMNKLAKLEVVYK
jgi:hypothetical protein